MVFDLFYVFLVFFFFFFGFSVYFFFRFYTLLVISTALFNEPPFKNLIVNGLVLAA